MHMCVCFRAICYCHHFIHTHTHTHWIVPIPLGGDQVRQNSEMIQMKYRINVNIEIEYVVPALISCFHFISSFSYLGEANSISNDILWEPVDHERIICTKSIMIRSIRNTGGIVLICEFSFETEKNVLWK